jgi:PKD repeat protein
MRRLTTAFVLALALALLAAPSAFAADATVNITDLGYSDTATGTTTSHISVGEHVTWNYANTLAHSVRLENGSADLCGAGTSPGTPPCTQQFTAAGRYRYFDSQTCTDYASCPPTFQGLLVVDGPPVASASGPASAQRGQSVSFSGSGSDPDGDTITGYLWDFGDGTTAHGQNVTHTYNSAGHFNVTLTVSDSTASGSTTIGIDVTVPDSDGDGIDDDHDACPAIAAPGTPQGCPVPPLQTNIVRAPVLGLAGVLKSGIATVLRCSAACTGAYTLTLKGVPIGSATGALLGPGSQLVVVNVDPAARSAVRRAGRSKVQLRVVVTDALGRARTLATTIQIENVRTFGKLPAIGISDEQATTFGDPLFQVLRLKYARLVTPWNSIFSERRRLDAWLQAARAAGAQPLVAFEHRRGDQCPRRPCKAPSVSQYRRAWRAFHKKYPWVKDISPWNEENSGTQPTAHRPDLAASYYNVVRGSCRGCHIVAADVLDVNNMQGYLRAFLARAKGKPRLWGLHNYRDTNHFHETGTRLLLATVKGQVWFTETGGIVSFTTQQGRKALPKSEKRAERAMAYMFKLAEIDAKRVKRIYVYQWKVNFTGDRFDAGVVRPNGTPRPSFDVLALNASIARTR